MSAIEDPMELSSDLDRRQMAQEDIDIDLDLSGEQPLDREDDYMVEDVNLAIDRGTFDAQEVLSGRDDEMLDDVYSLHEAEDNPSEHDEDLEDATYLEPEEIFELAPDTLTEHYLEDSAKLPGSASNRQDTSVAAHSDQSQTAIGLGSSNNIEATVSENFVEVVSGSANAKQGHEIFDTQEHLQHLDHANNDSSQVAREVLTEDETIVQEHDSLQNTTTSKKSEEYLAHSLDPEVREVASDGFDPRNEISSNETTFNIHPVTVVYQGSEMSLFPPADQDEDQDHPQTYFLHDENLAGESLANLFRACRVVLAESIEEEAEELEITIGELGLQISEVSLGRIKRCGFVLTPLQSATECSTTTLSQILDLYVHLQQYDGDESPGPLYIVLSTKFKLTHRLNYLLGAVAEGKGLSQLMPSEGVEEEDQHSDSHFEQEEEAQGKYPQVPKRDYNAEVGRDFFHEAPTNEDANDEDPTVHHLLKNLTPGSKEDEVEGATVLPLSANQASEPEKIQMGTIPSNAHDDVQQLEAPIDESLQLDFDASPTADKEQNAIEDPELIYYEDEHDLNHESSAGSSTIQGDLHEVNVDSHNRSFKGQISAMKSDDAIPIQKVSDSPSTAWPHDQPSIPTYVSDASGDDAINYSSDAEVEQLQNTIGHDDDDFKVEIASMHHQEKSQKPVNEEEEDPLFNIKASYNNDTTSLHSKVESISNINIPQTSLIESSEQRGSGQTPSKSEFGEFNATEQSQNSHNAKESASRNTDGTNTGDDITAHNIEDSESYQSDEFEVGDHLERTLLESSDQTLVSSGAPRDQLDDSDEITYEGDGNEPEPLKVYSSDKKSNFGPVPSKRVRSDQEGLDTVENSREGKIRLNLFGSDKLKTFQADAKRLRSE